MTSKKIPLVFIIICCCFFTVSVLLSNSAGALDSVTVGITGRIPLVTYNISVIGIDTGNATVTWSTNGNANSTVLYGTTTSYGSSSTDDVMTEDHTISLHSLTPGTIYHYQMVSVDLSGNQAISADQVFTTANISQGTVVTTTTTSTTFSGTTIQTVGGVQQVSLNESTIQGTIQVSGNTVNIQNPGNGWATMQYVGSAVTDLNGNISTGQIQSVSMVSDPVTASLGSTIGTVSTQINIGLTQIVPDLTIQQSIIEGASPTVSDAFQIAAANNNLNVQAIAYTVQFQNTAQLDANLNSAGVELNMSVDNAWVAENANGSVNNVKIFRFGDDGTEEVLSTTYLGSQGTTDYFQAVSPHGISTFGIAAVASSSTTGSSSSSGTNGGNSGSSGSGRSQAPSAVQPVAPAQVAPAPQVQPRLGPPQNAPTTTQSLVVAGLTTTTGLSGIQVFAFNTTLAAQSGVSATVENATVIINQPGLILTIVTNGTLSIENGEISGTVQSVGINTTPSDTILSFGRVSVSINASLATIPENAAITTTVSEVVSSDVKSAFQRAAKDNNRQIEAIAYVLNIEKTNFEATGPATVTMTIIPDWVTNHGGIGSIAIVRIGDDQTVERLATTFIGTDGQGSLVFDGYSPHGLSVFGLTAVTIARQPQQSATSESLLQAEFGEMGAVLGGITGLIKNNYAIILVVGLITAGILAYVVWRIRRRT